MRRLRSPAAKWGIRCTVTLTSVTRLDQTNPHVRMATASRVHLLVDAKKTIRGQHELAVGKVHPPEGNR